MARALCWTTPTNVLRFLKYSVLKRSGQMCSAAFITLGCVLCVEMIIVITQWKAADERLSPPLMSYLSTHAWCRVQGFCFWMIYCRVRVAYVLLKLGLVNDRECALNTLPAMGAVFSRLHLWEHQSQPPAGAQQGLLGQCLGMPVFNWTFLQKYNQIPFKVYLEESAVSFAHPILLIKEIVLHDTCSGIGCISPKTFPVLK